MKKLVSYIPPHILILIPVILAVLFIALVSDQEVVRSEVAVNASFFKMPNVSIFNVIINIFKDTAF